LAAEGITRRFGPVVANDGIDLSVRQGEIHAIVGQNGAGKSTLMRIFQGLDYPDEGDVVVDGRPVRFKGPADALTCGIGMVHQEFMLAGALTLVENLVLGAEPGRSGLIDRKRALSKAEDLARQAGVSLDWTQRADRASVPDRQIVEILRLLYRGADILILDEPTAVLAPSQVDQLFDLLRSLRRAGHTILFISHKLREVLALADRVTVLRQGQVIETADVGAIDEARLAHSVVGETIEPAHRGEVGGCGEIVLEVSGLVIADRSDRLMLDGVAFNVAKGEILGVAGVAGNGQEALIASLVGLLHPSGGRIAMGDRDITRLDVQSRRDAGIGYVSADRAAEGLCQHASVTENAVAGSQRSLAAEAGGWLWPGRCRGVARSIVDRYQVVHGGLDRPVADLSGGNQQRLLIGREIDRDPNLLLIAQPTRGVDVKGIAAIHSELLAYRERGGAIIMVSEELDELIDLSDRILVLCGGRQMGIVDRLDASTETLAPLMVGVGSAAA
jgi:simple sugar transport system ATP-binding protein